MGNGLNNLFNWKLNTLSDYILVLAIVFISFGGLYVYSKIKQKHRNEKSAIQRVDKKLNSLGGKKVKVWSNVTLKYEDKEVKFHNLYVDDKGVVAIKVYGRGLYVYGQEDDARWKVEDKELSQNIANPIKEIKTGFKTLELIIGNGQRVIEPSPLVIFADNFDIPVINMPPNNFVTIFKNLGAWYKKRQSFSQCEISFEDLVSRIEKSIVS